MTAEQSCGLKDKDDTLEKQNALLLSENAELETHNSELQSEVAVSRNELVELNALGKALYENQAPEKVNDTLASFATEYFGVPFEMSSFDVRNREIFTVHNGGINRPALIYSNPAVSSRCRFIILIPRRERLCRLPMKKKVDRSRKRGRAYRQKQVC